MTKAERGEPTINLSTHAGTRQRVPDDFLIPAMRMASHGRSWPAKLIERTLLSKCRRLRLLLSEPPVSATIVY